MQGQSTQQIGNKVECPNHIRSQIHSGDSCIQKWVYIVWKREYATSQCKEYPHHFERVLIEKLWPASKKDMTTGAEDTSWDKAGWKISRCLLLPPKKEANNLRQSRWFCPKGLTQLLDARFCWEKSQKNHLFFPCSTLPLRLPSQEWFNVNISGQPPTRVPFWSVHWYQTLHSGVKPVGSSPTSFSNKAMTPCGGISCAVKLLTAVPLSVWVHRSWKVTADSARFPRRLCFPFHLLELNIGDLR